MVVFTKFDKLVSRMEERLTSRELEASPEELCLQRAEAEFENVCVAPLKKINRNLSSVKVSGGLSCFLSVLSSLLIFTFPFSGFTVSFNFIGFDPSHAKYRTE